MQSPLSSITTFPGLLFVNRDGYLPCMPSRRKPNPFVEPIIPLLVLIFFHCSRTNTRPLIDLSESTLQAK